MSAHVVSLVLSSLLAAVAAVTAAESQLAADFTRNAACPVFRPDSPIELSVQIPPLAADDVLQYRVSDYLGRETARGEVAVTASPRAASVAIRLDASRSGWFGCSLRLAKSGLDLPRVGSRPRGIVSYSVLPRRPEVQLAHGDDSRFGAQGCYRMPVQPGDDFGSLYAAAGLRWIYLYRRLFDIGGKSLAEFDPGRHSPAWDPAYGDELKAAAKANLTVFSDIHSLPSYLQTVPTGVDASRWPPSAAHSYQCYPPRSHELYADLIGRVVRHQRADRRALFPAQRNGYYEINWEPDWHWKGSPEEFLAMYRTAFAALHRNDPDGLLLGANYGVLKTGNDRLEQLFGMGLGKYLDGIVTHLYYLPMDQSPEAAGTVREMRRLDAMRRKYLPPGAKIINSEWGVQCSTAFGKTVHRDPTLLAREAAWLLRGHLIALGEGAQATFFFYTVDHGEWGLFFNLSPNGSFQPQKVSPKPAAAAVAAATRLLEGSTNAGTLDMLGRHALGYLFRRPDGELVAALWSTDDRTRRIKLPVDVPQVTLIDPMGNESPLATVDGVAEVEIGANPVYVAGMAPSMAPVSGEPLRLAPGAAVEADRIFAQGALHPVKGRIPAFLGAGPALLMSAPGACRRVELLPTVEMQARTAPGRVLVSLKRRNKDAGKVRLELRDGGAAVLFAADCDGDEATLPYQPGNCTEGSIPLTVAVTDAAGAWNEIDVAVDNVVGINAAAAAPQIDGDLREWNLEKFRTVDSAAAVKIGGVDWLGVADLSYRCAVEYDQDGLYFAVHVRDRQHLQRRSALDGWMQDSLQIGIGVGRKPDGGYGTFAKFCFSADSQTGALSSYRHNGTGRGCPPGPLAGSGVRFGFRRIGEESCYEIAIPWNELDERWEEPPPDKNLGLGILVNDADVEAPNGSPRKAMEFLGGMAEGDPARFGKAVLTGEPL